MWQARLLFGNWSPEFCDDSHRGAACQAGVRAPTKEVMSLWPLENVLKVVTSSGNYISSYLVCKSKLCPCLQNSLAAFLAARTAFKGQVLCLKRWVSDTGKLGHCCCNSQPPTPVYTESSASEGCVCLGADRGFAWLAQVFQACSWAPEQASSLKVFWH